MLFKLAILSVLVLVVILPVGCRIAPPVVEGERIVEVRTSDGPLALKSYKKLGFNILLPKKLIHEKIYSNRSWRNLYDFRTVCFVIAHAPDVGWDSEDMNVIQGHVNVYSPSKYEAWMRNPGAIFEDGSQICRWKR